jgi:hypothetical protein
MGVKTVSTVKLIRVYSKKELADLYAVCPRTLDKWIGMHKTAIGEKSGRYYSLAQIQTIFEVIGLPKSIVE